MTVKHSARIAPIVLLVALAGCSESGPQVAPVHGRVTLDGQPLPHASVVFRSSDHSPSGGRTDQNGNYQLIYKRGVMGAFIGTNDVSILEDTQVTHRPQRVPARYNEKSELQVEVKPSDNEINFDLTSDAQ
jgi:hypothetical protein